MEKIKKNGLSIMGIKTTADNFENLSKVGKLWEEFFSSNCMERIPGKVGNKIYGLYTDFESDEKGRYSFIIGCEVNADCAVPQGMVLAKIEPSSYAVFRERGDVRSKLPEMWGNIWNAKLERKFIADYEVYDLENFFTDQAEIELYIGVK